MKTGLESLDTGAPKITYSSNEGPKSPKEIQMASYTQEELEAYEQYKYDMEEQRPGMPIIDIDTFIKMERSTMNEGGIAQLVKNNADGSRPGYRGPGGYQSGQSDPASGGSTNTGNGGNGGNRREQYSVARTTTPRTQPVSIAPTTTVDDRGTVEQNLNTAKAIINAQLQPTTFNKYKNFIPFIGTLSKIGLIPSKEKKFSTAVAKGLIRDLYKVNPTGNMITPNFFDTEEGEKYLTAAGAFPKPFEGDEKDGRYIPPIIPSLTTSTTDVDVTDADATDFENRFQQTTSFNEYDVDQANRNAMIALGVDPRMFAADGGRIGYAGGGITDLRQGYFLGKLVKKIGRGIKKIAKSPIGKAALFAVGANYAPLLFGKGTALSQMKAAGGLGKFLMGAKGVGMDGGTPGLLKSLGLTKDGYGSLGGLTNRGIFSGITALSSLPLFMGEQEEDDLDTITGQAARGPSLDIPRIRREALAGNLNPADFPFMAPNFYAANGGIAENRMAALNELYGINDEEEQKLSQGGSAGLPPITMVSEGVDTTSFPDDESTGIAQATPTMPNQMPMPMRQPMMNPMMARMNPMMNLMMARMNPMMNPMMGRGMPMMGGRMMAQEGGLMDMGGMEKDYRNEGGFVAIGGQERADDVPARLSKNEFVFTADAVRNAGDGDIDKGAEIMANMMENLEAGGKVSKASQGLEGARAMFATQQRLEEVL
jgi:hypothetical protein